MCSPSGPMSLTSAPSSSTCSRLWSSPRSWCARNTPLGYTATFPRLRFGALAGGKVNVGTPSWSRLNHIWPCRVLSLIPPWVEVKPVWQGLKPTRPLLSPITARRHGRASTIYDPSSSPESHRLDYNQHQSLFMEAWTSLTRATAQAGSPATHAQRWDASCPVR